MEKDFELVEHTADIGIRAYGANKIEAYANAARAMASLITDSDQVREAVLPGSKGDCPDPETLAVAWLNELIYLFDTGADVI